MAWFRVVVSTALIGGLFPLLVSTINGDQPAGGTADGSRWGRVDFTRYCGGTIGELIDILGNDYVNYYFDEEPLGFMNSCTFIYSDGEIRIWPATFMYCDRDHKYGQWKVGDFIKERIDHIQLEIRTRKSGLRAKTISADSSHSAFILDYSGYIGGTIDSLLQDVGYACEKSWADTAGGCYYGCYFCYPNHVTIRTNLEVIVPIPANITARNLIDDYVLQQKIGTLTIYFCERKGERF